jgi:phosphoribosylanthranilate isomerase
VTFTLLPAVDVADGSSVRLVRGDAGTATVSGGAREAALAWQAAGAAWIHVVDLDAALGRGSNAALLADVVGELDVAVELSGGIRDDASLAWARSTGCERIVLGTAALEDPAWCARAIVAHGARIAVALDVRVVDRPDGSVRHVLAARGATRDVGDLWDTLAWLDRAGCARYVVTDVSRDGTLLGPNVELHRSVARATTAPVIASGGISAIADLVALVDAAAGAANVEGAIVGRALYAGRFTLPEALDAVRRRAHTRTEAAG